MLVALVQVALHGWLLRGRRSARWHVQNTRAHQAAAPVLTRGPRSCRACSQVAPAVDEGTVKELEAMGFSRNKAVRAVYHSGGGGCEPAVNWLMEHEQDADVDQPLLVTQVGTCRPVPSVHSASRREVRPQVQEMRRSLIALQSAAAVKRVVSHQDVGHPPRARAVKGPCALSGTCQGYLRLPAPLKV